MLMNQRPNRFRAVNPAPHDPKIIAGYSLEMLDGAIEQLSNVPRPGPWEIDRLKALKKERATRSVPSAKSQPANA